MSGDVTRRGDCRWPIHPSSARTTWGSLLRPQSLLDARRQREAGTIDDGELRAIEDEAIAAAVAGQQEAGIDVITDGEFRRRDFRTGLVDAVEGMSMVTFDMPWHTASGVPKLASNKQG